MRVRLGRLDLHDERGVSLVIVALSMVVIFGMVVLAVDLGGMLVARRRVVNANDGAALAAAQAFAMKQATCGSDEDPAKSAANGVASGNDSQAVPDDRVPGKPAWSTDCAEQTVTVRYYTEQPLFFAPILGFDSNAAVTGSATAAWGVAGSGAGAAPIQLDSRQLYDCGFPDDINVGDRCGFWYNNNDLANSSWGLMSLETDPTDPKWGFDVPADHQCQNAGTSDRDAWILGTQSVYLKLNYPTPTYACVNTGVSQINSLLTTAPPNGVKGMVRLFPVNDPAQQVDRYGNICTPAMIGANACNLDKFDIVGFASLLIVDAPRGNTPQAIGSSGGCSAATGNSYFTSVGQRFNVDTLGGNGCPGGANPDYLNEASLRVRKGSTTFVRNVDYTFTRDGTGDWITWIKGSTLTKNVQVSFDWTDGGACPGHASDPNAYCLITEFRGFSTDGGDPGPGLDFGTYAVALTG